MASLLQLLCWCLGFRRSPKEPLTPAGNLLPKTVHKVLHADDLGPGRLIIIGDVHGCHDTLTELLEKVEYKPRHDNLILVGDLVNKGPKSRQVVATARTWCANSFCSVVRGNHDDSALAAGMYISRGGDPDDLQPKLGWVTSLLPEDLEFLRELPFSIEVKGYNILVVHAALVPGIPLESQDLGVLTKVRDLVQTPDGRWIALEEPREDSQAWAPCWQGPHHVFFGHDAKRGLQQAPCATGLDTGCVYGRELTACVLPPLSSLRGGSGDAVCQASLHGRTKGSASTPQQQDVDSPGSSGDGSQSQRLPATPSFEDLRGELHSVPSTFVFDKAAAKAAKAEKKAAKLIKKKKSKH